MPLAQQAKMWQEHVITLKSRRNEQHFADDIFKRIFFNENVWISIKISLKFVPKGPISNIPALVQIMAWRRSGDKPLSEPMMVSLPTHKMCHSASMSYSLGSSRKYHLIKHFSLRFNLDFVELTWKLLIIATMFSDWKSNMPFDLVNLL